MRRALRWLPHIPSAQEIFRWERLHVQSARTTDRLNAELCKKTRNCSQTNLCQSQPKLYCGILQQAFLECERGLAQIRILSVSIMSSLGQWLSLRLYPLCSTSPAIIMLIILVTTAIIIIEIIINSSRMLYRRAKGQQVCWGNNIIHQILCSEHMSVWYQRHYLWN